jgi:hypothetical protein
LILQQRSGSNHMVNRQVSIKDNSIERFCLLLASIMCLYE